MPVFGPRTTAQGVIERVDLQGKTAVVTGAASGLGMEIVRALAQAGAEVVMPVRDLERGCALADRLMTDTGNTKLRSYQMDLADFDSVRRFCDNFLTEYTQLDILINNAGVMACPLARTREGYELQFAVNHLGHFLLTGCLLESLQRSAAARVVAVSSVGHRLSPVVFEDIHFQQRRYDKWLAYGQSKTANILFALRLNTALEKFGGRAYSGHPGGIMTNLQRHLGREEMRRLGWIDGKGDLAQRFKTPAQGAATPVWAAVSDDLRDHGGAYCENCAVAPRADSLEANRGVQAHAVDVDAAAKLWTMSEHMVDLQVSGC